MEKIHLPENLRKSSAIHRVTAIPYSDSFVRNEETHQLVEETQKVMIGKIPALPNHTLISMIDGIVEASAPELFDIKWEPTRIEAISHTVKALIDTRERNANLYYGALPISMLMSIYRYTPSTMILQKLNDVSATIRYRPPIETLFSEPLERYNDPRFTLWLDDSLYPGSIQKHPEAWNYFSLYYSPFTDKPGCRVRIGGLGFLISSEDGFAPDTLYITNLQGNNYKKNADSKLSIYQNYYGLSNEEVNMLGKNLRGIHFKINNLLGRDWRLYLIQYAQSHAISKGMSILSKEPPRFVNETAQHYANRKQSSSTFYTEAGFSRLPQRKSVWIYH